MVLWRIYYYDGTTIDDSQVQSVWDTPFDKGLICIVERDPLTNIAIMSGWHWYYYFEPHQQWWGCQTPDDLLFQQRLHPGQILAPLRGSTISSIEYKTILDLARNDPDFPHRSAGKNTRERP